MMLTTTLHTGCGFEATVGELREVADWLDSGRLGYPQWEIAQVPGREHELLLLEEFEQGKLRPLVLQ